MSNRKKRGNQTLRYARLTLAREKPVFLTFLGHMFFVIINAFFFTQIAWIMPMLALKRFGATGFQCTVVTATGAAFFLLAVLWGDVLKKMSLKRYLLMFWLVSAVPIGLVSYATNYWMFLALHIISAAGFSAWIPAYGKMLKIFYPDAVRGRFYGIIHAGQIIASVGATWLIGQWLDSFHDAFRIFLPAAALVQIVGVGVLMWMVHRCENPTEAKGGAKRPAKPDAKKMMQYARHGAVSEQSPSAITSMFQILAKDRIFLRYEMAFMTYGGAFMICSALLPIMAEFKFGMTMSEYSQSTEIARRASMLFMIFPMGLMHDRLGAMKTCSLAFLLLACYPVVLVFATSSLGILIASAAMGLGMAGVAMGWMLGPVSFAKSDEDVPKYTAIHGTLVGIRAIVIQPLGYLMYKLTGSYTLPFIVAAILFFGASVQMWYLRLAKDSTKIGEAPTAGDKTTKEEVCETRASA